MHRHLYRHLLWAGLLALGATTGCDDGDGGSTTDSGIRDMEGPGGAGGMPMGGEGGGGAGGVPVGGTGGMPMGGDGGQGGMPMGGDGGEGGMPMGGMGGMPMGGMGGEGGMPMGGMGGVGGGVEEGDIDCGPVDPPAEGTCEVTPGNDTLVITGTLLGPQGLITGGSMTVTPGGIIDCVGCDCADDAATQINCGDAVVSPGLINAHDHITFTQNAPGMWGEERYDHRHDWRRGIRGHTRIRSEGRASGAEVSWGELRQLITGTTSLVGSGGADGLLRNLDRNQEGLMQGDVALDTFPLGDTGGELRNGNCDYPDLPDRNVLMDDAWSPHVAEGIDNEARNEFLCLSSMDGVDVTGSNGAFIHGVGLTAVDGAIVADRQTAVIWSPRSNISLYGHTAPVTMLETQGVLLGLGTDWTPSGSINMQRELACADRLNRDHYNGFFSDRDLWLMATGNNAQALAVADGVGSLQVGLAADIAVYAAGDGNAYRAVIDATPADTVLVLRSGDPLYGDVGLVGAIPGGAGCEDIPLCDTQKTVCLQSEIGQGFNALQAANQGSYDLTFCGVPPDEPTCIPSRPNEFDGAVTPDDNDGDGVPNDEDNCPDIFNPARPIDGMGQADHDRDGLGDVCDVCPIDADTDECSVPDPNDRDADGVPEDEDNCPGLANPDQADADEDGKGDLCDPCPVADPAGTACPGTIQQIKTNDALIDSQVQVDGVVTAIDANGNFFIQMPDDAVEDGPAFSGIFVFAGNATIDPVPELERGQSVRVTAQFGDFFGQRQLSRVAGIEVLGDGAMPTIALVESAQVGTGGELAAAHEGTLVRVADVEVTAQNPEAGPGDRDPTNSIVVDDVLRINDLFYAFDPLPAVGVSLPTVAGVLRFANGDSKLEPRDANDVEQGPPALLDLGPADGIIRVGETRVPTTPEGELILRLTAPAPEGGLMVAISFEPEGIANGMAVMVPAGELRAPVVLTGVAEGATTVTASLEGSEDVQADVQVIAADAAPTSLTWNAERIEVLPGADLELILTADVPGPFDFGLFLFNDQQQPAGFMPNAFTTILPAQAPEAEGEYQVRAVTPDLEAVITVVVSAQPAGADLVINEVDYDQPGADGAEFAEIFNPTGVAIPLAGVVFEAVNGSNGQVYGSYDLSDAGAELPAGGYLVIANAAVIGGLPEGTLSIVLPGNGLQNGGPDGVRLVRGGEFLDGLAYEGAMDGVTEGNAPEAADMGEGSLSRCANGADTDDNAADFMLTMMSTPGAANACP